MKKIQNNKSLTELAYSELKNAILKGELSQGDPLVEENLAKKLNVSRTIIQRALLNLKKDNLVVKNQKNNRMYVKKIDKKETIDLWEVRKALEILAIKKVCESRTDKDIKKLYSFFDKYKNKVFTKENIDEYALQDQRFHRKLAKISNNGVLLRIINNFQVQVSTFNIGIIRHPEETLEEHLKLIKFIEDKNLNKAEKLMEVHLTKSMKKMVEKSFN